MRLGNGRAILPRIRRSVLHSGGGVVDHGLPAAHLIRKISGHCQLVALCRQRVADLLA